MGGPRPCNYVANVKSLDFRDSVDWSADHIRARLKSRDIGASTSAGRMSKGFSANSYVAEHQGIKRPLCHVKRFIKLKDPE